MLNQNPTSEESFLSEVIPTRLGELLSNELPRGSHYSAYWAKHLRSFDRLNPMQWPGIGSGAFLNLTPRKPSTTFISRLEIWLSAMLSCSPLGFSSIRERRTAIELCRRQSRAFDYVVWSHAHVLRVLNKAKVGRLPSTCVIGDGLGTMVGLLACQNESNCQTLLSVNLSEILLIEYEMLRRLGFGAEQFVLVESREDLEKSDNRDQPIIFLIPAQYQDLLQLKRVDLFINIDSMQEMSKEALSSYFSLISQSDAYFYCCNLVTKTLRDGTVNRFDDYPWGNGVEKFYGSPRWRRRQVGLRPAFGRRNAPLGVFHSPHFHKLIKYPGRN